MSEEFRCSIHGLSTSAIVCGHMIAAKSSVGFVENSDDPNDLQAWCEGCEAMFLREGAKTPMFLEFNQMAVVCADCYRDLKARHTRH
jgi:hypothetical protein